MNTPTVAASRKRAKDERLQAHWEVPGHVATVYNVEHKSAYRVSLIAGIWRCECPYGQYGHAPCKHVVRVVDKLKQETQ